MHENVHGASYIRNDSSLFEEENDLIYGRVINVKFVRKDKTFFTIRSDYEPIYHEGPGGGTVEFVQCSQKPSIKLAYNQVSNSTVIEVKIQIDALYIDREMAGHEIDSSVGNPVAFAVVQLGYIGQFPDWREFSSKEDLERFYDLNNHMITSDQGVKGGRQLVVQMLTSYATGLPPDQAWVFNGVVGSIENGLRWDNAKTDFLANYGDTSFPSHLSEIETVLYQFITRRFIRSSVTHDARFSQVTKESGDIEFRASVEVEAYDRYKKGAAPSSLVTGEATSSLDAWKELKLAPDGAMNYEDADMFGIVCSCSQFLRSLPINELYRQFAAGEKAIFIPADEKPFNSQQDGVGQQLRAIQQHYQFLRWYSLKDGNFYFYHVNEHVEDIFKDPYIQKKQIQDATILPAVYDITMGATRTIRCPFFSVIDPMTTVFFQSRLRLVDDTGYWYQPKKGLDAFLVLLASVEFSTTGDENIMTLMCTDVGEKEALLLNPWNGVVTVEPTVPAVGDYTTNVTQKQEVRNNAWAAIMLTSGLVPFKRSSVYWTTFAVQHMIPTADREEWKKAGKELTLVQALTDLRAWNTPGPDNPNGVWTTARMTSSEGPSPEQAAVPECPFQIPWLYTNDVVMFRSPYRPDYLDKYDQKDRKINET